MKTLGYLLLIGGFLGGAFATALDTQATNWAIFWPAAVVAALGLLTVKRAERGAARAPEVLQANRQVLAAALANIVAVLDELRAAPPAGDRDLRDEIDARLRDDLERFAEARESLVHLAGLQAYANIMSEFAAGERYVNRVWSATADGYDAEALDYLERAAGQFRQALAELDAAGLGTAT